MSLFDDDFYSTRVTRRTRLDVRPGQRKKAGFRSVSPLPVAILSSIGGALVVVLLFVLLNGGHKPGHEAKAALAGGQTLVETSERIITASEKVRPSVVSIINLSQPNKDEQASKGSDGNNGD